MKTLVLRFDIDTYRCINQGVPNLLEIAREENVKFTFFCNMGRAISRPALLRNLINRRPTDSHTTKLSASAKLGHYEVLRTLISNPMVGMSRPEVMQRAHREGHDIGLHGGRNHGAWQHGFHHWDADRIRSEVSEGKSMFEKTLGIPPAIFSSPGWRGSDVLDSVLKTLGFAASANRHGHDENDIIHENGFCLLPTNLVAEPGGVAYFEWFAASGYTNERVVERFQQTLSDDRNLYVLYDHPCYAGIQGLETVRRIVRCAREQHVEITTLSAVMRRRITHS